MPKGTKEPPPNAKFRKKLLPWVNLPLKHSVVSKAKVTPKMSFYWPYPWIGSQTLYYHPNLFCIEDMSVCSATVQLIQDSNVLAYI